MTNAPTNLRLKGVLETSVATEPLTEDVIQKAIARGFPEADVRWAASQGSHVIIDGRDERVSFIAIAKD
jgi:hypothetical protein